MSNPFQMLCRCRGRISDQKGDCTRSWGQPGSEDAKVLLARIHFPSSALTRNNTKVLLNFFLFSRKHRQNYDPPQRKQPVASASWTFKTAQFLGQECCVSPWLTRLHVKLCYHCIRRVPKFVASLMQPWKYVDWRKHCVHLGDMSFRCKKLPVSCKPLTVGARCGSAHLWGCREETSASAI